MLKVHVPGLTEADIGCTRSKTGLCKDCALYISMPFDVKDQNGKKVESGATEFECAEIWAVMGTWDTGAQAHRTAKAVIDFRNHTQKQHSEFMQLANGHGKRRLSDASGQN
jgi:hypothetical protein